MFGSFLKCLSLLWLFTVTIPCWAGNAPPKSGIGTITDALGHTQTITLPVKKMLILPSDAVEIVRMLGISDRVVGVNKHIVKDPVYWPKLSQRPGVGHPFSPSYEKILSLWPDLVVAYSHWPGRALEEKLTPLQIKVLRLNFFRLSDIRREVREFGALFGKDQQARTYINWMDGYLALLEKRTSAISRKPLVYLEGYTAFRASGPGSGGFEMGTTAGGNLISSSFSMTNPKLSTEFIAKKNPDIIVKMASGIDAYHLETPRVLEQIQDQIMKRPGWHAIKAVRSGQVLVIASDIGPGPAEIIGVLYMAKFFYPKRFKDIDIQTVHKEYLERFQHIPLKGCFSFPEPRPEQPEN